MKLSVSPARLAEAGDKTAVGTKFLYPVVAPVRHVNVALAVEGESPGQIELALTVPIPAPTEQVLAIGGELLDPVVVLVHHVHVVVWVDGDSSRSVNFSLSDARDGPIWRETCLRSRK